MPTSRTGLPTGGAWCTPRIAADAVELRQLDLESGQSVALTSDGHVNVDPRWSPDGTRIAFVSTQHEGRWHVFVVSRGGRRGDPDHRGPQQRAAALLLQRLGSLPLAHVVPRRQGPDPRQQPRAHLGLGRLLAHGGRGRRADARDPLRGDDVEGAPRLGARRPPRRVQQLPRPPVEPALGPDRRGRRSAAADLRRIRPHRSALVPRRPPHRRHLQRRRQHVAGADRRAGRAAPARGGADPPSSRARGAAGRDRRRRRHRTAHAGPPVGHRSRWPQLRARRRLASRRRGLRARRAGLRARLLPHRAAARR